MKLRKPQLPPYWASPVSRRRGSARRRWGHPLWGLSDGAGMMNFPEKENMATTQPDYMCLLFFFDLVLLWCFFCTRVVYTNRRWTSGYSHALNLFGIWKWTNKEDATFTLQCCCKIESMPECLNVWRLPKIGLPPVIIHFERWHFPYKSGRLGTPMSENLHWCCFYIYFPALSARKLLVQQSDWHHRPR